MTTAIETARCDMMPGTAKALADMIEMEGAFTRDGNERKDQLALRDALRTAAEEAEATGPGVGLSLRIVLI